MPTMPTAAPAYYILFLDTLHTPFTKSINSPIFILYRICDRPNAMLWCFHIFDYDTRYARWFRQLIKRLHMPRDGWYALSALESASLTAYCKRDFTRYLSIDRAAADLTIFMSRYAEALTQCYAGAYATPSRRDRWARDALLAIFCREKCMLTRHLWHTMESRRASHC